MNYRTEALIDAESATTAATKTIDIDLSQPISRLVIEFKGTNDGSTPTAHGAKMVSKIELVDGSDIFYSLSGIESQALSYYNNGFLPFQVNEFRNDVMNIQTFNIEFGRYLWDTQLAFDPARFSNPQLKITHNKASGGSAPNAGTLSVFADVFDDKRISPMGFFQCKEHYTYSLTSSATEAIDLPTDYPLRKLIVQSLSGGKQPWEQYNKLKLVEDQGKKTPINLLKTSDIIKLLKAHPRIEEVFLGIGTGSAVDHYCNSTYDWYANISGLDAALTNNYLAQDYGGTQAVVGDSSEAFQVRGSGLCPHGALEIPFGLQDDMADWYDLTNIKSLRLDITAGSSVGSSSTAEIVVQQLRRY